MRLAVLLLTLACLGACQGQPTLSENALMGYDNEARQRQAVLDAEAIMQGMAQARQRADQLARSAR
ncbi:MAG TPA: hypothetical protein VFL55_19510 [Acetobacteraceae bacterium]|jgi:hypothetical protein|nr:hypothetical protein [Acetobacteraceae bacterium]